MKKIIALAAITLLTACEPAPESYQPEPFAFERTRIAPTPIHVKEIRIVENYTSRLEKPFVEYEFPVTPSAAVQKWAATRLRATGASGILEIVIDDASVKEVPLPKTEGFKGLFIDDQEARYDATLKVSLRLYTGAQALSEASGDVFVTRSHSINEHATVFERRQIYHQMTSEMIAAFDSEANARLGTYFRPYLK
jgi:hypothetical protein